MNDILSLINFNSGINLVYGKAATGKTTLALMLVYNYSKLGKVIFIDTENSFSIERFKQISHDDYDKCLKNILLIKANNFIQQHEAIKRLANLNNLKLVVIDSLGKYYRMELKQESFVTNKRVQKDFRILKELNNKNTIILITNQVYESFKLDDISMVGGNLVKNLADNLIRLEKDPRKLIIEKPVNKESLFEIQDKGIILK
ncbi:MAG: AAA family ATPase [Nanoarchaeota archaeon]